ncbi:MAG: hypothetical protein IT324_06840 [Anaerolineae bacterium]|nr:hypothetical protein [Anaerolineae bacterium]
MSQLIDLDKPKLLVDFAHGTLLPSPRSAEPHRRETFYPVACANPLCTNVRWLTRSNAIKAEAEQRVCRKCQAVQAGKRGFAATRAKYGAGTALYWVQQAQIARPSRHEITVDSWLSELGASYQRQVPFTASDGSGVIHNFVIDFVVETPTRAIALEVNGYHHKKHRAARDYWLAHLYPGAVLFIDTDDMDHQPDAVKAHLGQWVNS